MPKPIRKSNRRAPARTARARLKRRSIVLDAIDELHIVGDVLRSAPSLADFAEVASEHAAKRPGSWQRSQTSHKRRTMPIPPEAIDFVGVNTALLVVAAWRLERLALQLAALIRD